MAHDESAWFHGFVERCRQRSSLPSVQTWVAAHEGEQQKQEAGRAAKSATGRAAPGTGRLVQISPRNDLRTSASVGGRGIDLGFPPPSGGANYNIFRDITLHDQAAATIASASQRTSGFNAALPTLEGEALRSFRAYLNDFVAPHWLMTYYREQQVQHEQTNHAKFVDDLVSIVVEGLRAVGGDAEATQNATESIRSLSQRLSSQASSQETLTLFSSFTMSRPNSTDPVLYGLFYTTLTASYRQNGKTEVLSSSTHTFSVIFNLISGVLIANEDLYNRLLRASVGDWVDGHTL